MSASRPGQIQPPAHGVVPVSAAGDVARTVALALAEAGLAAAKAVHEGKAAEEALYAAQESIADAAARAKFSTFRETEPGG